jgi:cobalt-zinc-cadmium resistance protein CzcA
VKDVADVRFGHFGAITGNGEVLGQVMMLKGANSKQVINDVKVRIAEIKIITRRSLYKWIPRT